MRRRFSVQQNTIVSCCPACGNNTEFWINSQQVSEDCCETWVTCKCGHDPHGIGERLEDTWGGTDEESCRIALSCWNDAIANANPLKVVTL